MNQRGSTLLNVLVIAGVISTLLWFAIDRVILLQRQSANLSVNVNYNLALSSLTDYAIYNLKNQGCFDPSAQNFSQLSYTECVGNYIQPKSTIRLLLSEKNAQAFFKQHEKYDLVPNTTTVVPPGTPGPATGGVFPATAQEMLYNNSLSDYDGLSGFEVVIKANSLSMDDPIKKIITNIRDSTPVDTLKIAYLIDKRISLPRSENEVYLRIVAQLFDASGKLLQIGAYKAKEVVRLYVTPRELNYYSLYLRGSILIGADSASVNNDGNLYIPMGNKNTGGIRFHSPVYAGKNFALMGYNSASKNYTPAYFFDVVTLGTGRIVNSQFDGITTQQALDPDHESWDSLGIFGGLNRGFEIDGKADVGLEVISDPFATGVSQANAATQAACLELMRSNNDLAATVNAKLYAHTQSNTQSSTQQIRNMRLAFSKNMANNTPGIQKFFNDQVNPGIPDIAGVKLNATDPDFIMSYEARRPDPSFPYATTSDSIAFLAAVKWNGAILEKIPLFIPRSSTNASDIFSTTVKLNNGSNTLATVKFTVKPGLIISGQEQGLAFKDLEIAVNGLDQITSLPIEFVKLMAYDNTCINANCLNNPGSGESKFIYLRNFTNQPAGSANQFCDSSRIYTIDSLTGSGCKIPPAADANEIVVPSQYRPDSTRNYFNEMITCTQNSNLNLSGAAGSSIIAQEFENRSYDGWEFSPNLRTSQSPNFATTGYSSIIFSPSNSVNPQSAAIYKTCTVPSTVTQVVGNFLCQELIINSRSTRLDMIGTFIVTNKMIIHKNALANSVEHPINFYSIHHPAAIQILQEQNVFKTSDGSSCLNISKPYWHPDPGLKTVSDRISCSPLSVFKGSSEKFPFRWTTVSADCIHYPVGANNTTCLSKVRNYIYKTIERHYGQ